MSESISYIILRNSSEQAAWELLSDPQRTAALTVVPPATQPDYSLFKGYKYKVVASGYKPELKKTGQASETLGAAMDMSIGRIYYSVQMTLRTSHSVPYEDTVARYGNYSKLEEYFKLNSAVQVPTNLITMVDNYGIERKGWLIGAHVPQPLTTYLIGENAHYFIPIEFIESQAAI